MLNENQIIDWFIWFIDAKSQIEMQINNCQTTHWELALNKVRILRIKIRFLEDDAMVAYCP